MQQFAPAKINLYLHIIGKRPDGFHELETLMAPISLGDTLEIELIAKGIEFTCSDPALGDARANQHGLQRREAGGTSCAARQ